MPKNFSPPQLNKASNLVTTNSIHFAFLVTTIYTQVGLFSIDNTAQFYDKPLIPD